MNRGRHWRRTDPIGHPNAVVAVLLAVIVGLACAGSRVGRPERGRDEGRPPAVSETPGGRTGGNDAAPLRNGIRGKVVGVSDGDTLTVSDGRSASWKIRLAAIDAPEKAQDFGVKAKDSLSDLAFGREAEVEVRSRDRYGRVVGVVRVGGADVNLEQLKRGFAWHYKQYSSEQPAEERRSYAGAEDAARLRRLGLWVDPRPVEPWNFRRSSRRR